MIVIIVTYVAIAQSQTGLQINHEMSTHHPNCDLLPFFVPVPMLTCPWHASIFNINSGEVIEEPAENAIPTYEVRVEGDEIQVRKP